jgi:hypothetical protein
MMDTFQEQIQEAMFYKYDGIVFEKTDFLSNSYILTIGIAKAF